LPSCRAAATRQAFIALFPFTDADGKEYLTFQNERINELSFYEMTTGKFLRKIKPARESNNGVGRMFG
jgi:hypothetical protein